MDGLNFIGVNWQPEQQPKPAATSFAGMVRQAAAGLAVFAAIVLATLGGIVLMDRLGIPLAAWEIGANP